MKTKRSRAALCWSWLLIPGLAGAAAAERNPSAPAAPPNVLFVAFDDLRTNLGCFGDPVAKTPNFDRLAARGTTFLRAYCQQPLCNPSRQSLLTGRRPDTLAIWDLLTHFRKVAPDATPLPEHFKNHGYFTQSVGKIYHGSTRMSDPPAWSVPQQFEGEVQHYMLPENRTGKSKEAPFEFADRPEDDYPDGKVAKVSVEALDRFAREQAEGKGRPFFLAVGFRKPHVPFTAPKKYWEMYAGIDFRLKAPDQMPQGAPELANHDWIELRGYRGIPKQGPVDPEATTAMRRAYYAATSFADAQLGRVLDALERGGFAENTIVVLWSDHGYHLGERGLWTKAAHYEWDTRVPLIVATPWQKQRNAKTSALVELLDIYPTLVELSGLPKRSGLEGESFARLLDDPSQPGKRAAFSQVPRPWNNRNIQAMGYRVRTRDHAYVEWRRFGTTEVLARELYEIGDGDGFETVNLADRASHAAIRDELSALLRTSGVARVKP